MIGNGSTFLLLLDRTCPLYTTTLNSAECQSLEPPADCSSDNGGAIAGALIGGILLGAAMTMIGVALAAFGLLWYRRQHHDADKAKMMKQLDTGVETPLSMRYIPADKNINARSNEDNYEPVSPYTHDSSDDTGLENPYESIQGLAVKSGQKENKKHVTFTKGSRENSGQKVIREDDSGYVLPDVLWEGKQRPAIAPAKIAQAQIPNKTTTSTVSVMIPPATEAAKVEYDVPEGVNVSKSHTHVQPSTSKIKGQREPSSQQPTIAVASQNQPSQLPDRSGNSGQGSKTEQPPTGKGHHKQLQRLVSKEKNSQHDLTQAQPQSSKSKEKGLTKPTKEEGAKPAKKVKPKLQQNASKLAQQYQTDSTKTTAQSHDTVKSKLQNLLSPSLAQGPAAHTPVLRQVSSSATVEKKVVQGSDSPASKVKAMASMLEGGVGGQAASSSETPDSKNAGAKRK